MTGLTPKELLIEVLLLIGLVLQEDFSKEILLRWVTYSSIRHDDQAVIKIINKAIFILGHRVCSNEQLCSANLQGFLLELYQEEDIQDLKSNIF